MGEVSGFQLSQSDGMVSFPTHYDALRPPIYASTSTVGRRVIAGRRDAEWGWHRRCSERQFTALRLHKACSPVQCDGGRWNGMERRLVGGSGFRTWPMESFGTASRLQFGQVSCTFSAERLRRRGPHLRDVDVFDGVPDLSMPSRIGYITARGPSQPQRCHKIGYRGSHQSFAAVGKSSFRLVDAALATRVGALTTFTTLRLFSRQCARSPA